MDVILKFAQVESFIKLSLKCCMNYSSMTLSQLKLLFQKINKKNSMQVLFCELCQFQHIHWCENWNFFLFVCALMGKLTTSGLHQTGTLESEHIARGKAASGPNCGISIGTALTDYNVFF